MLQPPFFLAGLVIRPLLAPALVCQGLVQHHFLGAPLRGAPSAPLAGSAPSPPPDFVRAVHYTWGGLFPATRDGVAGVTAVASERPAHRAPHPSRPPSDAARVGVALPLDPARCVVRNGAAAALPGRRRPGARPPRCRFSITAPPRPLCQRSGHRRGDRSPRRPPAAAFCCWRGARVVGPVADSARPCPDGCRPAGQGGWPARRRCDARHCRGGGGPWSRHFCAWRPCRCHAAV